MIIFSDYVTEWSCCLPFSHAFFSFTFYTPFALSPNFSSGYCICFSCLVASDSWVACSRASLVHPAHSPVSPYWRISHYTDYRTTLHGGWAHHPSALSRFSYERLTPAAAADLAKQRVFHIFTDGAYTTSSAGAAFVVIGPSGRVIKVGKFSLSPVTSAYGAECLALTEALQYILHLRPSFPVFLYSDCLSLLVSVSRVQVTISALPELNLFYSKLPRSIRFGYFPTRSSGDCRQ